MSNFRPAGLSDEDSDSDDYGFYEKPAKRYFPIQQDNSKKKLEINLQDAVIHGNLNEVNNIILSDLNGNVNIKLDSGWTPLMHACFHAQNEIVEYLLEKGADPNLHSDSVTPIMVACSNSSANDDIINNIVSKLVDKNCILNIGDKYGQTPLMRAIGSGRVGVVQRLLDKRVNLEMRDQQGWTAVFWAVHHNKSEILEILISSGVRLTEVDKMGRKPMDIAYAHDYQNIIDILNKYLKSNKDDHLDSNLWFNNKLTSWHDYYPDINIGEKVDYTSEIPHLLYGMSCERVGPIIEKSGMDLRSFLLMEEKDMMKLGIDLPYERQRLKFGLRTFHLRGWKLNAVAGLYARRMDNYSVLDCLSTLGNHLQQVYILEATLQYTLREFKRIQDQLKFEPPDSPVISKLRSSAKKILSNINNIRRELKNMKNSLSKISRCNPPPADLIIVQTTQEKVITFMTEVAVACTLGLIVYQTKNLVCNLFKK